MVLPLWGGGSGSGIALAGGASLGGAAVRVEGGALALGIVGCSNRCPDYSMQLGCLDTLVAPLVGVSRSVALVVACGFVATD